MQILGIAAAAVVVLAIILILAAALPFPLKLSPEEAADVIRDWLSGEASRGDYDAFLSCELHDPRVAKVRDEFAELLITEFADAPPAFLTPRGIEIAQQLAGTLDLLGDEASGNA